MKQIALGLVALACTATFAAAQDYGRPAYADNWNGGAPLPPLGAGGQAYYTAPQYIYAAPQAHYGYVAPQPQYTYVAPQVQYVPPQPQYYNPQGYVVQPYGIYQQPQTYTYRKYVGTTSYRAAVPAVQGPPESRCIVANLNGARYTDNCMDVNIRPVEDAYLRQKFSGYRRNSGYTTNLPMDGDFRR
ncbi:MAG: hypothetical protein KDK00_13520 [Rhodobacteraceae bacterium]|nr:hypothetical protein [Paracoccaceae bacterium]